MRSHLSYFKNLHTNIRFYILAAVVIVSIVAASQLRLAIASDQLYLIRLQQLYGLFAVILLYGAVILTPISKLFKRKKLLNVLLFSRRAIGVSAAYFAILHTAIALIDQVGKLSNLALLPERFKVAFVLGGIALIILFLMAATSFDIAMKKMTFKRWKQLHQFVYLAGVLIIVHVWLIGTHADIAGIRIAAVVTLGILFALESIRIVRKVNSFLGFSKTEQGMLAVALSALMLSSLFLLPVVAGNYHSDHTDEASSETTQEENNR